MIPPDQISIEDYTYELPDDKIALQPLQERDASKLLIYKNGNISESTFAGIHECIPAGSLLVFNDTKVINARLLFKKSTGANIEIFCLEPSGHITEYSTVMTTNERSSWKCLVGGAAKWKNELLEKEVFIHGESLMLYASMKEKLSDAYLISFSWIPAHYSFAAVIEAAGDTPLPPYIKRSVNVEDSNRYQTIFAKEAGSVAAPTAGLHFTPRIFENIAAKNIQKAFVTLHVGAGTFKPVKAATMQYHEMHAEYIDVNTHTIETIIPSLESIIAVGTTSARTLETLYWLGVKTSIDPSILKLELHQWDVYQPPLSVSNISAKAALESLLLWMKKNKADRIFTQTQLLIVPGYLFRIVNMLITNFHQPQSTLLLLVAAAIGDEWKNVYQYALNNHFRFLSYGDGNLIFIDQDKQ
ncbi:MAG: S-adenosylmethionine:tRNA ribosyltransferase-isomerase [Ferruginibacter sp.]